MTMTESQRLRAALLGEPVDRAPIWLREGFDFTQPPADAGDFLMGWQADPEYRRLLDYARERCCMIKGWGPGAHFNRTLGIVPGLVRRRTEEVDANTRRHISELDTPRGTLMEARETRRGTNTSWFLKHYVEQVEDLEAILSLPFEVTPVSFDSYERAVESLGDSGLPCLGISSPWVSISATMSYENALAWSALERDLFHEILQEITDRYLAILEELFKRPIDTMANLGGCEQCTPPMMSPTAFAEFVTPYDSQIVGFLKRHNVPVKCHCHGAVRNALPEIIKIGYDATEPVEPPFGGGDLTMAEAREIVGDHLTLMGNMQFDEFERSRPGQIRERVREIAATGIHRLVFGASAGPISALSPRMIENYYAFIDEALEVGVAQ